MVSLFDRVENIARIGENTGYQHFSCSTFFFFKEKASRSTSGLFKKIVTHVTDSFQSKQVGFFKKKKKKARRCQQQYFQIVYRLKIFIDLYTSICKRTRSILY